MSTIVQRPASEVAQAFGAGGVLAPGPGCPDTIQWMPPGEHEIVATYGNKPTKLKVVVDRGTATTMQKVLESYLERAQAGSGDKPYFDFNHEDREASAHPQEFFWAGEDPFKGGVRVRLQWTEPGRKAVVGRAYRRFSPAFVPDENTGRVKGSPANMGGLVNRAAFPNIEAVWNKLPVDAIMLAPPARSLSDLDGENLILETKLACLVATMPPASRFAWKLKEMVVAGSPPVEAVRALAAKCPEDSNAWVQARYPLEWFSENEKRSLLLNLP